MSLLNFDKLADELEVEHINEILDSKPHLFEQIKVRQEYDGTAHGDTRSIFLRWCKDMTPEAVLNDINAVEYPATQSLRPTIDKTIEQVMELTKGEQLGRMLIVELKPRGFISPHPDEGPYAEYYQRFHLCLQSAGKACFTVEQDKFCGEYVHMVPGELWWFNHRKTHSVFNGDDIPRLHMIFDIYSPSYKQIIADSLAEEE